MSKEKDPAFLFYSQDFFTDTVLWDDAELGRYIRLLCLQHVNGPFDPDEFERMTQVNDLNIRSKFRVNDKGQFYNRKLEEVREKRNEFLSKQRENGRKGGRPRNSKKTQVITQIKPKENPTVNPSHNPSDNPNKTMRVENENIYISTLEVDNKDISIKDIGQIENSTVNAPVLKTAEPKFFSTIKVNGKDRPDPKDESHPFNVFWNEYPRRVKRINAERAFKNNVKSWDVLKDIIVDIKQRFAFGVWDANEVKYIPHPTTYLNNLMWEDELTELKSVSKNVDKEVKSIASMPTYDDGLKVDIDPEEAERIRERIKGMSNKQEEEQK